jgi:hypothetical protein
MSTALLLLVLLLPGGQPAAPASEPGSLRDGDLVFQESRSSQSAAVALATGSRLTHMGVVLLDGGRPMVLEAVEPVRLTPFDAWRRRGAGGRVQVRRLDDADARLTPEAVARLRGLGRSWLGRHYDLTFRWDDDRLYCSELAWKLYDRVLGVKLGRRQRAGDLALGSPEVQRKLRERYGPGRFDPAETVVTPQAIFEDPRLVAVSGGRR